jgi:hypothetical protein
MIFPGKLMKAREPQLSEFGSTKLDVTLVSEKRHVVLFWSLT